MKFSPQVAQQIIAAIVAKMPDRKLGACSLCNTAAWELLDAFVTISLSGEPQAVQIGGQILPNAVLICTNCGNTHFLNLNRLGLGYLLQPESTPSPSADQHADTPLPLREPGKESSQE